MLLCPKGALVGPRRAFDGDERRLGEIVGVVMPMASAHARLRRHERLEAMLGPLRVTRPDRRFVVDDHV